MAKEMSPSINLEDGDIEFSQGSKADKVADEMDYTPIRRSVFGRRADTMNYQYLQGYIKQHMGDADDHSFHSRMDRGTIVKPRILELEDKSYNLF